jgi:hypothetical protein
MRKVGTGRRPPFAALVLAAGLVALSCPSAYAINWQSDTGAWSLSWDTTIGYGQGWRVSGLDCRLIATANGGCGYSPNIDDGDLNFPKKAAFSEAVKGVTELSLNFRDKMGLFVRADGLYDFEIMDNQEGRRIPLNHEAKNLVGSYTRLLDAFGFWRFDLASMPAEIRLGRQVVSWGESTFIQGGLNQVNHFDVSALRVPGAELKEALLPDEMAVFNLQLTKNFSTQLLYLFDWHDTRPEPAGSYYSTNDFGSPGGNRVFLGFGTISDLGVDFRPLGGSLITDFQAVNRLPDHKPPNSGSTGSNSAQSAGSEPRHGARLLPELHQPPAGGVHADRHAEGIGTVSAPPMRWVAPQALAARSALCGRRRGWRRGQPSRRPLATAAPGRRPRAAVRHHRCEHAARRRQRKFPGEQHRDLRVRQDRRLLRGVPAEHQDARCVLQHPDPADRHRAAG